MTTNNRDYPPSAALQKRFIDAMPQERWTTSREVAAVLFLNIDHTQRILRWLADNGHIDRVGQARRGWPHLFRRPLPNRECTVCGHVGPLSDFNRDYRHDSGIHYYPGCKKCRNVRENARRRARQETSQSV